MHARRPVHFGAVLAHAALALAFAGGCGEGSEGPGGSPDGVDSGNQFPVTDTGVPVPDGAQVSQDSGVPPKPDGTDGTAPLAALQGDYLLRFHNITRAEEQLLGEVVSETVTFGVMRVVLENGALVGTERLCHSDNSQTAENGTVMTTVSDTLWPNLQPVRRSLQVDTASGTWSSPAAMRRQGWSETAATMPTDPETQADLFRDPDGDGAPGVKTRVTGEVNAVIVNVTADCEYDLVSASTTAYTGTLSPEGLFAAASVEAIDSQAHALTATMRGGSRACSVEDINANTQQPVVEVDDLKLVRVQGQWLDDATACPSEADFMAALP